MKLTPIIVILITISFLFVSASYGFISNTNLSPASHEGAPLPTVHLISATNSSNVRYNFTLYAVDEKGNVSVINGLIDKLDKNIKIEGFPALMAFSPSHEYGYVDQIYSNSGKAGTNITVINTRTNSIVGNITGLSSPVGMAVSPNGSILYVSSLESNNLSIVSLPSGKIIDQIDVGAPQGGATLSPNGTFLYVTENEGTIVKVYNAYNYSLVANIDGFKDPAFVAFTPNGSCAYITNFGSGNVSVINTRTFQIEMNYNESFPTDEITISPNGDYAYVAVNPSSGHGVLSRFSVIDIHTHQIIKNVSLGGFLGGIAISPNCSNIYVPNQGTGNITILNALNYSIVENLTGYGEPFGVYVIPTVPYYGVTFHETGLPSGTTWYVNITGEIQSGPITSNYYNTYLPNGSYSYTVSSISKTYSPSYQAKFTVFGSSLTETVLFSEVKYTIYFKEQGLPSGEDWYLNISGIGYYGPISTVGVNVSLPNGTYTISVSSIDKIYSPHYDSSLVVYGSNVSVPIIFTKVTYKVVFKETGLPNGTTWFINITGNNSGKISSEFYNISLSNGTYRVVASAEGGYSSNLSSITVNGENLTVQVTFHKVSSPISDAIVYEYIVIGAVVVIVAALAVFALRRKRT